MIGLSRGIPGKNRSMGVLRVYALLTATFTIGLAVITAFMHFPRR